MSPKFGAAGRDFVAKIQRELAVKEYCKGQLISKANCQAEDSSKKWTNEFVFTSMRRVFVRILEESSARKKNVLRLSDL